MVCKERGNLYKKGGQSSHPMRIYFQDSSMKIYLMQY